MYWVMGVISFVSGVGALFTGNIAGLLGIGMAIIFFFVNRRHMRAGTDTKGPLGG